MAFLSFVYLAMLSRKQKRPRTSRGTGRRRRRVVQGLDAMQGIFSPCLVIGERQGIISPLPIKQLQRNAPQCPPQPERQPLVGQGPDAMQGYFSPHPVMGERQGIFSPSPIKQLKQIAPQCPPPLSVSGLSLPILSVDCQPSDLIRESSTLSLLFEAQAEAHKTFARVLTLKVTHPV